MNYEARRMLLLAAVDGTIDELPTMLKVDNPKDVICLHYGFRGISASVSDLSVTERRVLLTSIGFGRENIGSVGRCRCGKVYFSYDIV